MGIRHKAKEESVEPVDGERQPQKAHLRDWKGLMPVEDKRQRLMVFGAVVLLTVTFAFEQLGLLGVDLGEGVYTYLLGLLVPVCAATLLLGRSWGLLSGLVAGVVQWIHALIQPLDLYELYFVRPVSSVLLYVLTAFILGIAFSLALKNDPKGAQRKTYLFIACFVTSICATLLFILIMVCVYFLMTLQNYLDVGITYFSVEQIEALYEIASFEPQVIGDTVLMFAVALAGDGILKHYMSTKGRRSVRLSFRGSLLGFVLVAFAVVSGVSFSLITVQCLAQARVGMYDELSFFLDQIGIRLDQLDTVMKNDEISNLSEEALTKLEDGFALDSLIDGYSLSSDGTVVVLFEGDDGKLVIVGSDNPAYLKAETVEDLWGPEARARLDEVASSRDMIQTTYNVDPESIASTIEVNNSMGYGSNAKRPSPSTYDLGLSETVAYAGGRTELGYLTALSGYDYYVVMIKPSSMVFSERSGTVFWTSGIVLILLTVVFLCVWVLLGHLVVGPIDETNGSLAKICDGNLDERVEVRGNIEFAELSDGINATVDVLKGYIGESERRIERDLMTAKTIQNSALPSTFPPFPEIEAFDIFASMNPAREVGGDFYDFFLIDDCTLGFLIADVSGKGIPGALFMMAAKAELENFMMSGMDLDQAVLGANMHLCHGNDAGMFVTVWAATLNWQTGELTYVNAGHNPPLLRHEGTWEWLNKKGGLFLGTFEMAKYRSSTLTLVPGDELLLYTDGVNEAFSVNEEEYGNDRLEAFLSKHNDLHPRALVDGLRQDVAAWAEGAEQSDDITILGLEFGTSPEVRGSLRMAATLDNLGSAMRLVDTELDRRFCPPAERNRIDVAFEELFVNVCHYAYAYQEEPGEVEVSYVFTSNPSTITVEIRDWGVPFNPVTMADPTLPTSIQEAKIGGLGIMMAKRCVDRLDYERADGANVVTFVKSW